MILWSYMILLSYIMLAVLYKVLVPDGAVKSPQKPDSFSEPTLLLLASTSTPHPMHPEFGARAGEGPPDRALSFFLIIPVLGSEHRL